MFRKRRMKTLVLFSLLALTSAKLNPLSDEFIEEINRSQSSWTAGRNFPEDTPMEYLKGLCGVLEGNSTVQLPRRSKKIPVGFTAPISFDAREKWPECPSIAEVSDQGSCSSSWALAPADIMTDRNCIASEGKDTLRFSAEDIMSCCKTCGMGCNGGFLMPALKLFVSEGGISGGQYDSKEGCKPYTIPGCDHFSVKGSERPPCGKNVPTPECQTECIPEYGGTYEDDRRFANYAFDYYNEIDEMVYDIVNEGPIVAAFDVYEDFLSYKGGVYTHKTGELIGKHAVRIIGYDDDDPFTPHWLAVNSWNEDWGNQGTFKILKGENECGIETVAGAVQIIYE